VRLIVLVVVLEHAWPATRTYRTTVGADGVAVLACSRVVGLSRPRHERRLARSVWDRLELGLELHCRYWRAGWIVDVGLLELHVEVGVTYVCCQLRPRWPSAAIAGVRSSEPFVVLVGLLQLSVNMGFGTRVHESQQSLLELLALNRYLVSEHLPLALIFCAGNRARGNLGPSVQFQRATLVGLVCWAAARLILYLPGA
jgi:hypothetical protein